MLAASLPAPALGGLARLARRGLSVAASAASATSAASAASAATTDIPFALPSRLFGESADRPVIRSVDCHCAGLPARIVLGGAPMPAGESSYERRHHVMHEQDWVRKLMITEPRGYPCQNVNIIYPSTHPEAAFGYVIGENNWVYPAMSGHNTICVATALLETGCVPMTYPVTEFTLEAPAGLIKIRAECKDGKAEFVTFRNTASFVGLRDVEINVPGGVLDFPVRADVAYGGMWYAIVDAASVGLDLVPENGAEISRLGEMIKIACQEQHPVQHPELDYPGCDILAFRGPPSEGSSAHARNAVVMSTGKLDWAKPGSWKGNIDRSPCGTGTSAIMAAMWDKGELSIGEDFVHESILGTLFTGRIVEETEIAGIPAIVPEITGQAWITQYSEVVRDPSDPFQEGYTVGDIWAS